MKSLNLTLEKSQYCSRNNQLSNRSRRYNYKLSRAKAAGTTPLNSGRWESPDESLRFSPNSLIQISLELTVRNRLPGSTRLGELTSNPSEGIAGGALT